MRNPLTNMMRVLRDGLSLRWRFTKAWIRDGKPLWLWLAIAITALGLPYSFPAHFIDSSVELADRVRWSGMLFQFLGLATVVWGLNTSRQLFGRTSLWKAGVQWVRRLRYIIKPLKPVSATGNIQAAAAAAAGFGAAVAVYASNRIEDRVAKLEGDMRKMEQNVIGINRDVLNARSEMRERINTERDERQSGDRKVSQQLEEATIGGIHLEVAGLAYLYLGILFTSVPRETACLLQKLGL